MSKNKIILIFLIVVFTSLALIIKTSSNLTIDLFTSKQLQQVDSNWFKNLMFLVSRLGDLNVALATLMATVLTAVFLKKIKIGTALFLSGFGSLGAAQILQMLIGRPRPDSQIISLLTTYTTPSFPSGHVFYFLGFYGFILYLIHTQLKNSLLKLLAEVIIIFLLVLIGISRVFLGAHWLTDVLGAYLIGTIWLYFVVYLYHKL